MRVETVEPGEEQTQGISHQCKTEGRVQGGQTPFQWCPVAGPEAMDMEQTVKWGIFSEHQQGTVRVAEHWNEQEVQRCGLHTWQY